jgi:hypothetical protein
VLAEVKLQSNRETHSLPMQPRGPRENGWCASLLSLSYLVPFSHRWGMNSSGSLKLLAL